jgi:hypothetical protein
VFETMQAAEADQSQSDAFLAFGHYTDELPDATQRIKSAVLLKMAASSGKWQERRVILTKNVLLIAKLGSGVVSGACAFVCKSRDSAREGK